MVDTTLTSSSGSLVQRMIRAARLEPALYEEVEADRTATRDAATAVTIVALAGGIGGAIGALLTRPEVGVTGAIAALVFGVISALVGWLIWSYVTYFVGTRLFGGRATPGEMLRTIGFAQSPGVLNILAFIPVIGALVGLVTFIWSLVAGVIAIRQALDFDTGKAVMTAVIGAIVVFLFSLLLGLVLAALGLGVVGGLNAITGGA